MEHSESESRARQYEIALVVNTGEAGAALGDELQRYGATIGEKNPFQAIRLAYPIKKQISGYFGYYRITADPESVKKISDALTLHADVLRFLIVTLPTKSSSEKPMHASRPIEPKPAPRQQVLTNEALEQTLEEILK